LHTFWTWGARTGCGDVYKLIDSYKFSEFVAGGGGCATRVDAGGVDRADYEPDSAGKQMGAGGGGRSA